MILKEGSKAIIYDKSFDTEYGTYEVSVDTEVKENMLMIYEGYLCCTDKIEKVDDKTHRINVYMQDALVVRNGILFQGIAETD